MYAHTDFKRREYREVRHPWLKTLAVTAALVWFGGYQNCNFPPPQRLLLDSQRKEFKGFEILCEDHADQEFKKKRLGPSFQFVFTCAEERYRSAHPDDGAAKKPKSDSTLTSIQSY